MPEDARKPESALQSARGEGEALALSHITITSGESGAAVRSRIRQLDRRFRTLYLKLQNREFGETLSGGVEEWLRDNDHLIGETIDRLSRGLTARSCRKLDRVAHSGGRAGPIRVAAMAEDRLRSSQGRLDMGELLAFLDGYQKVRSLTLAELWAFPSFLALSLLEWLEREIPREEVDDGSEEPEGESRRRGRDGSARVGSAMLSLRLLAQEDWREFVEASSEVERILRGDPAGVHPRMDFRTRDRYRHAVEELAEALDVAETEIATRASELARGAPSRTPQAHVGYYLIDQGREEIFREFGMSARRTRTPQRMRRRAGIVYFGSIGALTVAALGGVWSTAPAPAAALLTFLAVIPALGLSISVVNWAVSHLFPTRTLPRLDFRDEIPGDQRTVVAVPMMLTSESDIESVVHRLEVNYLGNADPALSFALLSDFPDARRQRMAGDEDLLRAARQAVAELNDRYRDDEDGTGPFFLLHRGRRWNAREGRWMGWERKRGKLAQLNAMLMGAPSELWVAEGHVGRLRGAGSVITLDADTVLPRGAASRLVGTLAHPLNRPVIGADGSLQRGFTVLQPRLEVLPESEGGTPFYRIFGGVQGLDLYAHAAFDVYQDLFDDGIFAGKGIYDVSAFETVLHDRVPENAILSHDLFEGSHGRAGLVSDVILLEDFPVHPIVHARRAHRWIRGDWQLLPWLAPKVPGASGESIPNPLSALSRWKIFDNLRRSLQPPALFAFLLAGWMLVPDVAGAVALLAIVVIGLPLILAIAGAVHRSLKQFPSAGDLRAEARALWRSAARGMLELAFLPYEAANHLDAIARTLDRLFRTRRLLLEWTTAAATTKALGGRDGVFDFVERMWVAPVAGVFAGTLHLISPSEGVSGIALGIAALWTLSPLLARLASVPQPARPRLEGRFDENEARVLARRTWGYFERFQEPSVHWLPPDNYQEDPNREVADRTSPTNIGMAMISTVVAWDLGFLGTTHFISRIRNTVDGMEGLVRYRGHFLNWYHVRRREPLAPLYVSTVDSGNLAAALLVVREALREARSTSLRPRLRARGVHDTICVLREVVSEAGRDGMTEELLREVATLGDWARRNLTPSPGSDAWQELASPEVWSRLLGELRYRRLPPIERRVIGLADGLDGVPATGVEAVIQWLAHLRAELAGALDELHLFAPWLASSAQSTDEEQRAVPADGTRPGGSGWESGTTGPTLADLPGLLRTYAAGPARRGDELATADEGDVATAELLIADIDRLDELLERRFSEMDFGFLYDDRRHLFRIGYSLTDGELDRNHYDLLASEARIASAVAIIKGEVPTRHWMHLGRPFAAARGGPVLLSWAGTMFEYLMPTIFLRTPAETLLHSGVSRAVDVQRRYGERRRRPWGISESGYHVLDHQGHYQYRAFGVPRLGLRRDEGARYVAAPYASIMAVSWAPGAVARNLVTLRSLGAIGPWGPYEAVDYGSERGQAEGPRVVHSYMSHHQGMLLGALGNHLTGGALVERFHRDPRVGTLEPYLHERIPWRRALERPWVGRRAPTAKSQGRDAFASWSPPLDRLPPPVHVLSNGSYSVQIGSDGRGGSDWQGWSIVRGGAGAGTPRGGTRVVYLDRDSDQAWDALPSSGGQDRADKSLAFLPHRAELTKKAKGIRTRAAITVAPRDDVEIRTFRIINEGQNRRRLRMALSLDVALAPPADDLRHPAFHKLFVRAWTLAEARGALFERRPRFPEEVAPALGVTLVAPAELKSSMRWEVDRERFVGRSGSLERPRALGNPPARGRSTEPFHPLDPIAGVVVDLDLEPFEEVEFTLLLVVGAEARAVEARMLELAGSKRRDWFDLQARARAEGELLALGASPSDLPLWGELLSHLLHPANPARSGLHPLGEEELSMPALWRWGISGDLPFVLLEVGADDELELLDTVLRGLAFWKTRGVAADLVVLDGATGGYQDPVRDRIRVLLPQAQGLALGGKGGVHILPAGEIGPGERERLRRMAALYLQPQRGDLADNLEQLRKHVELAPPFIAAATSGRNDTELGEPPIEPPRGLVAPSGPGGFDPESEEYRIHLGPGASTPAPWANVIAGDPLGFLVTESGGGFTWSLDAGEFRLTPWANDPVLDPPGEVLYLRDQESGRVWTPTPRPLGAKRTMRIQHGWGHTGLHTGGEGLSERISWFLHPTLPVKVVRLTLRNKGEVTRLLTVNFFVDWVLGTHRAATAPHLLAAWDSERRAVLARNPFVERFAKRVAFLATDGVPDGFCVDRAAFLGPDGRASEAPPGVLSARLPTRRHPDGEVCGVLERVLRIEPGAEAVVHFYLGEAEAGPEVDRILGELQALPPAVDAPEQTRAGWREALGTVRVQTPEPGLDRMMNGWLGYQTLNSRIRGRTGLYQSGGAFGFRDQLQDVFTLLPLDPEPARHQLVAAAARQFEEGDVLHWWHPGTRRGVRTRCSDDLLWLPFVLAGTASWTGDMSLLDIEAPWLQAPPLPEGTHERYDEFDASDTTASLWEHGTRALECAWGRRGARGLPLMGTGDWNDGMDRVGQGGRGESVWMAWFLIRTLDSWRSLALQRRDDATVDRCTQRIRELTTAVERHAWDGEWYRRAFFDDGSLLGSSQAPEAQIDSIAQSWATLSGVADPERARIALHSAARRLVKPDAGLALLLTPPFDGAGPHPGYIAAYPPGVRENGGQYTHAAAWLLSAFARSGDGEQAGGILRRILPSWHAAGEEGTRRYRVEPYVVAADIYGAEPHVGRGGWTWYTGSAGWIFRVVFEDILGIRREGDHVRVDPCIPPDWPACEVGWKVGGGKLRLRILNPAGVSRGVVRCTVNGVDADPARIPVPATGVIEVEVELGAPPAP